MFVTELFLQESEGKLIAIFRKGPTLDKPTGMASKIYLWKTGPGENAFEMEVGQEKKRIPVTLPFEKIKATMALKGFTEEIENEGTAINESNTAYHRISVTISNPNAVAVSERNEEIQKFIRVKGDEVDALKKAVEHYKKQGFKVYDAYYVEGYDKGIPVPEASMTKSIPNKQGSIFNKGVEKLVGQQVAIVANDHPDNVSYGLFKRIGETGLCHIKLNGGKLRNWAAGDMIAVQPNEVFAPWDSRLKDLTSIHREYDDNGEKIVREIDDLTVANLQAKRLRDLRTQPDEVKGEIAKGKVRGMWDRVKGREALKRKIQTKQNPPVFTEDEIKEGWKQNIAATAIAVGTVGGLGGAYHKMDQITNEKIAKLEQRYEQVVDKDPALAAKIKNRIEWLKEPVTDLGGRR
jgi:hypothetical protein